MVAPLKKVLMRRPDHTFCIKNPEEWHYSATPDLENALFEHREFAGILEMLGVEVVYHDKKLFNLADAIYVYDPALITDAGAILLRMGKELRRGEESGIENRLKRVKYTHSWPAQRSGPGRRG